jgi:hypothetical protein
MGYPPLLVQGLVNHIETGLNLAARWRLQSIATDVLNFPLFQMHRCWFSMTMVSSRQLPPNRYRQWGEHLELQRSKAPAMLRPRADQLLGRVGDPQLKVAQLRSRTPHLGALHVFFGCWRPNKELKDMLCPTAQLVSTQKVGMWNNMEQLFRHT